jgi:hypothetical protein
MSRHSEGRESTPIPTNFLVELRGFEPLTSAVPSAARLTSSSLPFVGGSSATSAHSWSPL